VYPTLDVTAHAKLNLTLRVIGRRADGFHLLDGLTGFCHFGDRIQVTVVDRGDEIHLTGPFASKIDGVNIVATAVERYRAATGLTAGLTIEIEKNIPVAAGLGGGSCDAGAILRVLEKLAPNPMDPAALDQLALSLGADVPACLASESVRMRGIGERLETIGPLPPCGVVLVNPLVALTAGAVFRRFHGPYSAPSTLVEKGWTEDQLVTLIGKDPHNDLIRPACALAPAVPDVLATLGSSSGVRCVGMSGSGATCFGIFDSRYSSEIEIAVEAARARGWWAVGTHLLP
jgi:4-diphosphocytidyl-2-C-methyl-D-erythritol kinase